MKAIANEDNMKKDYTQTRLALLEQSINNINATLSDIRLDIRDLDRKITKIDEKVDKLREEFYTFNKWLIGIAISGFIMTLSFGTFVIKFFN